MNAHDVTLLNEKLHRCRKVLGVVLLVSVAVGVVMALLYDIMIGGASVLLLGGISAAIYILATNNLSGDVDLKLKRVVVRQIDGFQLNGQLPTHARQDSLTPRASKIVSGHMMTVGNLRYWIGEVTYERLKDKSECEFHYAKYTNELLGIFPVGFDPQYGFDSAVPYLVV